MSVNFSERLLVGATQTLVITSTRVNEAPLLGTLMTYLFSQRANERWSGDGDQSLFFFFFFWVESLRGRGKWECGTKRGRAPTSNLFTQASRKSPTRPRGEEKKQTKFTTTLQLLLSDSIIPGVGSCEISRFVEIKSNISRLNLRNADSCTFQFPHTVANLSMRKVLQSGSIKLTHSSQFTRWAFMKVIAFP